FWLTKAYAWFGLPYFIYDTWAIYNTHYYLNEPYMSSAAWKSKTVHFFKGNTAMIFHHVMLPLIFFPTILFLREDKGDYFVGLFYMVEAAIPFISLRFILAQLQFKDSAVYIISGLLMILVFFLARVCVFPFLYWKYSVFSGIPFLQVPFTLPIKCNIGCLILLVLQVYFLFLMIRGAF
ncbi:TLC3B-like protein, partial [Mya arenaria]